MIRSLVLSAVVISFICFFYISPITYVSCASSSSPAKSRPVPLSIDFGSEFIKVSSVRPGAGSYHIVVDEQSKRKIPAVVSFEGGERHFGNGATQLTMRKPKETYWFAHRLLGKNIHSPQVQTFKEQGFPYEIVEIDDRGTLGFRHTSFNGSTIIYSIEEVIAMSLEHIVRISETDAETSIHGAVITVPNYWSQMERQAMLDAADLAGLNVYALINENTAAALQYGIDRTYDNQTAPHVVLLYNMGSTSTKVTINTFAPRQVKDGRKNKTEGSLEVLSVAYDDKLGGQYFESVITDWIAQQVNKQLKAKGHNDDIRQHPRPFTKIRFAAEKAKSVLSANQDTQIHLPSLIHDTDFKLTLTREHFYELSQHLLHRVAAPIHEALADANLTASQLDSVTIIGGGVRIPAVQAAIREACQVSQLGQSLNGDEAMAMGAEFKAIELSKQFKTRPFTIEDVTPYGVGVRITNQANETLDNAQTNIHTDSEHDSSSPGWAKNAGLFKRYNKLSKKKTVTFAHDRDFTAALFYDEASIPHLPQSISSQLIEYNITGLTAAYSNPKFSGLLETQKPRVTCVFLLDQSGLVSLTSADATLEETIEVPVSRKVPKAKKNDSEEINTTSDIESSTDNSTTTAEESSNNEENEQSEGSAAADETEATTATASSNETDGDRSTEPETETITEYKTRKVTHRIPLTVTARNIGTSAPMSYNDKKEARARLGALSAADDMKKQIAFARNNLESYIYNTRAALNDGIWDAVSNTQQRDELFTRLAEAEEWLYDQQDENAEIFIQKLNTLKLLSDPLQLRYTELTDYPKAVEASKNIFNFSRAQVADYAVSRPWVKASDLQRLYNMTEEGETWLSSKIQEQAALAEHEVPVLTSALVYERLMPIADLSASLLKIKKPAEPKPKIPKATRKFNKTDTNNTHDGNATNNDNDTPTETETENDSNSNTGTQQEHYNNPPRPESEGSSGAYEADPSTTTKNDGYPTYDEL